MNITITHQNIELTVSTHGAEMQSLKYKNREYIRDTDAYWNRKAPLLFPIVGKLRDLKTYINGSIYHMNQHGFLRDQEFCIESVTDNKVTLSNTYSDETLKMYPFKYKIIVTYMINDCKVDTIFTVQNIDNQKIMFNYGGHPGFNCPLYDNEDFTDYRIVFEEEENFDAPTVMLDNGTLNYDKTIRYEKLKELKLDYKYFEIDAIVIPKIKSHSVKLLNKNNQGLQFDYPGFPTLAIWTKPNAKFICLEPWVGHADSYDSNYQFIEKEDIVQLEKEGKYTICYSISIIE